VASIPHPIDNVIGVFDTVVLITAGVNNVGIRYRLIGSAGTSYLRQTEKD
tara:strand:- start:67764 stop:67913 length:150 start_codon:yes stop_codon:yes gene_type:complete